MQLPNGPQTPPVLQMLRWIASPLSYMEATAKRYGDIFTLRIGNTNRVFVSNPNALQQILTSDTKEFEAPGELNRLFAGLLGKRSVITTTSRSEHQRQRQLLMPPFHGDRMRSYGHTIENVTEEIISHWECGKTFCVRSAMQAITMRVIMQAVFGLYESPRAQKIEQLLREILEETSSPISVAFIYFPFLQKDFGPRSPWGKRMRRQQQVDELIYEEIRERREKSDASRTDVLSLLMEARDEAGQPMTDEELHDELMTLLVAGHETTATALTWALYWIHKLPSVREKLLQEIHSLGDRLDSSSILKLPYLNAVYCETLRICPVAMLIFGRAVKTPLSLMGYQLEPGTEVVGSIYLTHQREDLYPEPKKFKPERFLERQFSPYEYLPFGGGARRCIGMAFAQFEMKVALVKILSDCELELIDNGDVKPKRRGLVTGQDRPIEMLVKNLRPIKSRQLDVVNI